ncbi:hypothetical protein JTB14_001391 [Gonioctena quinquepunctata]|nr:hypothetical protein JTB14_001391 [Gonioctena quinquepunctata]
MNFIRIFRQPSAGLLYSQYSRRYTHKNSTFTEEQKLFYEENGYILMRNNVKPELLDKICQRFIDICEGKTQEYSSQIAKDPVLRKKGISGEAQDFLFDDVLWEYASDRDVVDVAEKIIGPNITVAHSMLINKPPDSDPSISKHPLHQDLHYFPFRPADKIVASWTAMEGVHERNGCLYLVPGSHNKGLLYEHVYPKGNNHAFYHGVQGMDHLPKINIIMEKGDTLFFHPLLLHGSGPNFTKGYRKAISCHYADSNCDFIDVYNTTQDNIATEIERSFEKRGVRIKYVDMWKRKCRLVRGSPGNFQKLYSPI